MKVKMILPALTEATSPFSAATVWRSGSNAASRTAS